MVKVVLGTDVGETLTGSDGDDRIFGFGGDDRLIGLQGYNVLIGGLGADTMIGGSGANSYGVDNARDVVLTNGGNDVVTTSVSWVATAGSDIEVLQSSSSGAVNLTGNLHPDSYAMTISAGSGIDRLDDGGGRAELYGGYGNDIYVVTNAQTVVHEFDGVEDSSPGHGGPNAAQIPLAPDPLLEGYDTVRTSLSSYTLPANVEVLTSTGDGDFAGTGNALSNVVNGGDGNDALDGGAGIDRLVGGAGDDTYRVDDVRDAVIEAAGAGRDTIYATSAAYVAQPNTEVLIFRGIGDFTGYANATGTSIQGGAGNDSLFGGLAADTLDGGKGSDLLLGKDGADVFVFHLDNPGVTRIVDFKHGVDRISFTPAADTQYYFTTNSEDFGPGDEGHPGTANVDHLYYDRPTGKLYHEGPFFLETGGNVLVGEHRLIATFDNHPLLTGGDLIAL